MNHQLDDYKATQTPQTHIGLQCINFKLDFFKFFYVWLTWLPVCFLFWNKFICSWKRSQAVSTLILSWTSQLIVYHDGKTVIIHHRTQNVFLPQLKTCVAQSQSSCKIRSSTCVCTRTSSITQRVSQCAFHVTSLCCSKKISKFRWCLQIEMLTFHRHEVFKSVSSKNCQAKLYFHPDMWRVSLLLIWMSSERGRSQQPAS